MPIYNSLEYSKNYRKTTNSLWSYYSDEPSNPLSSNSEPWKYKTSINGNTCNLGAGDAGYDANKVGKNETEVAIPLKHLSNFRLTLPSLIPLINCEIELVLIWSKNCALADMTPTNNPSTESAFQITDAKLYVPVVTLSTEKDKKLLEQLKSAFKRTVKWNK